MTRRTLLTGLALALLAPGCSTKPPAVVPVEGVVTLDGVPLPRAHVEFVPDLKDFGAEYNSSAVTDENGRFTLVCALGGQPGAAVATHKVLVTEHTPDELRGMSAQAQTDLARYMSQLKNRPIPEAYANLAKTPLTVEVKAGQGPVELKLTRSP